MQPTKTINGPKAGRWVWLYGLCLVLLAAVPLQAKLIQGFYPGWEKYERQSTEALASNQPGEPDTEEIARATSSKAGRWVWLGGLMLVLLVAVSLTTSRKIFKALPGGLLLVLLAVVPVQAKFQLGQKKYKRKPDKKYASCQSVGTGTEKTWTEPVTGMAFMWCRGGRFQMGSTDGDSDEKPVHEVCVDGFWMGKYEVTQGQWRKIMDGNPSHFKSGDNYPVEQVSWDDAQDFIKKLSGRSGKTFRLPTEAEWEYAARAGTTTPFAFGATITPDQVNYNGNYPYDGAPNGLYRQKTTPVGSFAANAFGLHDMHGNVWEWCQDWYAEDYYRHSPRCNPQGPSSGCNRVLRGGCWRSSAGFCQSAIRGRSAPGNDSIILGLRLVSPAGQ